MVWTPARRLKAADEVRAFSTIVTIAGNLKVVTADPDDDSVLECAAIGYAQFVVTGDRHLLNLGNYQSIRIVTAAEMLGILKV